MWLRNRWRGRVRRWGVRRGEVWCLWGWGARERKARVARARAGAEDRHFRRKENQLMIICQTTSYNAGKQLQIVTQAEAEWCHASKRTMSL